MNVSIDNETSFFPYESVDDLVKYITKSLMKRGVHGGDAAKTSIIISFWANRAKKGDRFTLGCIDISCN